MSSWTWPAALAGAISASDLSLTLQHLSPQLQVIGHGITGDKVTLERSTDLHSWATVSGIVLRPGLRARNQQQQGTFTNWDGTVFQTTGFPLPISNDGSVTFLEGFNAESGGTFYRLQSPDRGWEDARARWAALKVKEYRYRLRRFCFCFGAPRDGLVHVKDGVVVDVEELGPPQVPPVPGAGDPKLYPTIDRLFGILEESVTQGVDVVQFHTDPQLGIPNSIMIDYLVGAADAGVSYLAEDFVRIE